MGTQPTTPLVLRASGNGEGAALPLAGVENLPGEVDGVPVFYRRMRIAKAGKWTHRGTGEPVDITPERMEQWVKNTAALAAAGVKPFLPGQHRGEFNAKDNHGYVLGLAREGGDLYATVQLFGEEAKKVAACNSRSIYVVKDARDARGNVIAGESIAHVALVPNPALPDLGPTVKIAASAGGSAAIEAPILEPAAETNRSNPMFKPETLKSLRTKLKLPDTTPEAEVAEKAAAIALADPPAAPADKSAEVAALSADKTRLEGEVQTLTQKVASLSASAPKQADPEIMRDRVDNYVGRIDLMTERGDLPKAVADKIKAKIKPEATLMLSASPDFDNKRPIDFVLGLFDGSRLGVPTGVSTVPRPTGIGLSAGTGGAGGDDPFKADEDAAKAWREEQLKAKGYTPAGSAK